MALSVENALNEIITGMLPSQDVTKVGGTNEAAGTYHSTWGIAGLPGAAAVPATGINGAILSSSSSLVAGQIWFPAPVAGKSVYLTRFLGSQAAGIGGATIADRIWHNSGIANTTTTAQAITTPSWDRDNIFDGSATGDGVQVALEVHTATMANAAITNTTLNYTNSEGTASRTATISTPASATLHSFLPFTLQAGDRGVRSIQGITLGTTYGATGTIHLVAYRQVSSLPMPTPNVIFDRGPMEMGLPKMHDGSVPFIYYTPTSTTFGVTDFDITFSQV